MRRYASRKQADAVEDLAILKAIQLRLKKTRPKKPQLNTPSRWPKSGAKFWHASDRKPSHLHDHNGHGRDRDRDQHNGLHPSGRRILYPISWN